MMTYILACANEGGEEVLFEGYENEMEEDGMILCSISQSSGCLIILTCVNEGDEEVLFEGYEYEEEGGNELETMGYDPHLEWNEY